jgi:hypothetical protein
MDVLARCDRREPELVITASLEAVARLGRTTSREGKARPENDSTVLTPAVA